MPDSPCTQWEVLKFTRVHAIQASSRVRTHMLSSVVEVSRRRKSVTSTWNTVKDVSILFLKKIPRRWAKSMSTKDSGPLLVKSLVYGVKVGREPLVARELYHRGVDSTTCLEVPKIGSM